MAKGVGGTPPVPRGSREGEIAVGSGRGTRARKTPRYIKGNRKGRGAPRKSRMRQANAAAHGAPLRGDPRKVWIPPQEEGFVSRQVSRRRKLKLCKALAAENGRRELPEGWWGI